jgi:hypothetical protein
VSEQGVFRDAGSTSCMPGFYSRCDLAAFGTGLCTGVGMGSWHRENSQVCLV